MYVCVLDTYRTIGSLYVCVLSAHYQLVLIFTNTRTHTHAHTHTHTHSLSHTHTLLSQYIRTYVHTAHLTISKQTTYAVFVLMQLFIVGPPVLHIRKYTQTSHKLIHVCMCICSCTELLYSTSRPGLYPLVELT